jgi:hypothetical protein
MESMNLPTLPASSSVSPPPPSSQEAVVPRLPENVLQQLHDANNELHHARVEYEKALNNTEFRHQERVEQAAHRLRDREQRLDEITAVIDQRLRAMQS